MRKFAKGLTEIWLHPKDKEPVGVVAKHQKTPEELRRGFMYQLRVKPREGMLFDFGERGPHRMWMENVLVPLDMLFLSTADPHGPLDDLRIVDIVQSAEPLTAEQRGKGESTHVLEVAGGFVKEHGLAVGDRVTVGYGDPRA